MLRSRTWTQWLRNIDYKESKRLSLQNESLKAKNRRIVSLEGELRRLELDLEKSSGEQEALRHKVAEWSERGGRWEKVA